MKRENWTRISSIAFLWALLCAVGTAHAQQSPLEHDETSVSRALIAIGCHDGDLESLNLFKRRNAVRCLQGRLGNNADGNITTRQEVLALEAAIAIKGYEPNSCTRYFEQEEFFSKEYLGRRELLEQVEFDQDWKGVCRMFETLRADDVPDGFSRELAVMIMLDMRSDSAAAARQALSEAIERTSDPFASLLFALFFPQDENAIANAERAAAAGYVEATSLIRTAESVQTLANAIRTCDSLDPAALDSLADEVANLIDACAQARVADPSEERFVYQHALALVIDGNARAAIEVLGQLNLDRHGAGAYLQSTLIEDRDERLSLLASSDRNGYAPAETDLLQMGGRPHQIKAEMVLEQDESIAYLNSISVDMRRAEFDFGSCVSGRLADRGFFSTTPPSGLLRRSAFDTARAIANDLCQDDRRKFNTANNPECYDLSGQRPLPSRINREPEVVQKLITLIRTDGRSLGMFGLERRLGPVSDWAAYRVAIKNGLPESLVVTFDEQLRLIHTESAPEVIEAIITVKASVPPLPVILSFANDLICEI